MVFVSGAIALRSNFNDKDGCRLSVAGESRSLMAIAQPRRPNRSYVKR